MRYLTLYLALCCALVAQTTKVGGSGTTKVGGAGTTKVSPIISASYNPATDGTVVEWLKADAPVYTTGTTQATNGQNAATWVASTGTNLLQATAINQPLFNTAVQNGLPAIVDDGSGAAKWMASSATAFGTLGQPYTVWIVMKTITTSGNPVFFDGISSSNRAVFYGNGGNWDMFAGTDTNGGAQDTSWHIFCLIYNGASSSITIDGGAPTTVNPGANSFVGLTINTLFDNSLRGSGQYGEIIIQNTTPGNKAGTLAYLRARWATF